MKILCFLLSILIFNSTAAQQYHFYQHEVSTDLLRMNPSSLFRHKHGMLYIGTREGVIAYDGNTHQTLLRNDGGNQEATTFFHDGNLLWIGYADGAIYTLQEHVLRPWNIPEGWPKEKITGLCRDRKQQLWISTYGEGLYVYAGETLYNLNEDDGLPGKDIYALATDDNGLVYAGTDAGLISCRFENGKKEIASPAWKSILPNDIITSLKMDTETKKLYIGTFEHGVWMHDFTTRETKLIAGIKQMVKRTEIFPDGILTLSADKNHALNNVSSSTAKASEFHYTGTESTLSVIDLLCDDEGNIWLLCNNNGLISAAGIFSLKETNIKNIQALLEIDGIIYTGNDAGLFIIDKEGKIRKSQIKDNILSLYLNKTSGQIWAGTFGNGIRKMNRDGKETGVIDEKKGLANNNVFCITTKDSFVWVSTLAGINKLSQDGKILKLWSKKNGLPTDYNYTLFADSKGNLWIGTDGKGVACIDNQEKVSHPIKDQTVISFAEDKKGNIWFCTLNNGLGKIEKNGVRWFGLEEGLTELHISGITADADGNIVTFHHTGMDIIHHESYAVVCIGNNVGIRKWEQNINAFYNHTPKPMLISEGSRIVTYRPVDDRTAGPDLVIKSARAGRHALKMSVMQVVDYDDNDFVIEYAGIWFSDPDAVQYRYKMKGIDTEWRYTKDQKLIYPNLPPGTYTFIIECATNKIFSGAGYEEIQFKITPAFWQTWWFYTLIIVLCLYALYRWTEARNKRRKQLEEIRMEQVRGQLDTLKSQINPHFLFNSFNTLMSIIETKPEQAVIFVEKLSDFYRNMLQFRDKDLIALEEEIEINKNYSFLLSQRFGNTVQINLHIEDGDWMILPLTLQILTENAVKHNAASKSRPLVIQISSHQDTLLVCNNIQPRLNAEKSTHFGLQSLAKRYVSITGKEISIQKTDQQFCVTIPLVNKQK